MKSLSNKKILLIIGWCIYTIFFVAKKQGVIFTPIIQGYLSDFLAIPLLLGLTLLLMRKYLKDKSFKLSVTKVLVAVLYISIVFEWILPHYKSNFHADIWDVVAYTLGGLVFLLIQNNKKINKIGH